MKYIFIILSLLFLCGFTTQVPVAQSGNETIVFLRHGEKPTLENGQLTCQGLNRALALPSVLLTKFGKPNFIFAPNPYSSGLFYYVRGLVTIEPTAIQLGIPVNSQYYYHESVSMARLLLSEQYRNSVIFLSWEHLNIVYIAKKIMASLGQDTSVIPKWPENDYDSLYVMNINWNVNPPVVQFIHDQEGLDNQNKTCPSVSSAELTSKTSDIDAGTFIFVPNAEQHSEMNNQLSCKGLNRSLALVKVLQTAYPTINQFLLPGANVAGEQTYLKSLLTIEPMIINKQCINSLTGYESIEAMLTYLRTASFFNQTIVITWPKEDLANLLRAVYKDNGGNVEEIPNSVDDPDRFYEIKLKRDINGLKAQFRVVQENLNQVPSSCPLS